MTEKLNVYQGQHTQLEVKETETMATLRKQYADLREAEQLKHWKLYEEDPSNNPYTFNWPKNISDHPYEECVLELAARAARFDAKKLNFAMLIGMFMDMKIMVDANPSRCAEGRLSMLDQWEVQGELWMNSPECGLDFNCPF